MKFKKNGKWYEAPDKTEFLSAAKEFFKQRQYLKDKNHWTKIENGLKKSFYVQGSQWSKDDYYVRPGISIPEIENDTPFSAYGNFYIDIIHTTIKEILDEADDFLTRYDSTQALFDLVNLDYEQRTKINFFYKTEFYVLSKFWQHSVSDKKIESLLNGSTIQKIRNDRLFLRSVSSAEEKKLPEVAEQLNNFEKGTWYDLFKIHFFKQEGNGYLLIHNAVVKKLEYSLRTVLFKKNQTSWYEFCNLVLNKGYVLVPENINLDEKNKKITLSGLLMKDKQNERFELILEYSNMGEIVCFWNERKN